MKVAIELPEDVFRELVGRQGTVKEVVEEIVIKAVRGGKIEDKEAKRQLEALRQKLFKAEEENERLKKQLEALRNRLELLEVENRRLSRELPSNLQEEQRNLPAVEEAIENAVKKAVARALTKRKSFVDLCREAVIATNNYLKSADEPIRLKMFVQDPNLVICEPKVVATFIEIIQVHKQKLQQLAEILREIEPQIEVDVVKSDKGNGYILLKSNANELHEVERGDI